MVVSKHVKVFPPMEPRVIESKAPCPFCGGYKWRPYNLREEPSLTDCALIDCAHFCPGGGFDECVGCDAILCGRMQQVLE